MAAGFLLQGAVALAAAEFKIVTASERGTYIQIGRNLAQFIAPQADIALEALPSAGSAENVRRLRYESGVKLALVQSDVYQAFLDQAASGNADARDMIRPLRVIVPLYNEEIYFVVREDSPLNYVHEIRNARINAGELGSGTALTTTTLYRLMFNEPIPRGEREPPVQRGCAGEADHRQVRRRRGDHRGATRQAARRHEARGAQAHQAAQVRSQPAVEPGRAQDVRGGDRAGRQLSEPAARKTFPRWP